MNTDGTDLLAEKIERLLEESKKHVVRQINSVMVRTYFEIGRLIVENEQMGESRPFLPTPCGCCTILKTGRGMRV